MNEAYTILDKLLTTKSRAIMATIIKVEGSAYRKTGAMMLFFENSSQYGVISAGCLEIDLALQADKMFAEGNKFKAKQLVYDMSKEDDLSWGRGAGCNGKVHILLEFVNSKLRNELKKVHHYISVGVPVLSLKQLNEFNTNILTMYIPKTGTIFGDYFSPAEKYMYRAKKRKTQLYPVDKNNNVFIQHYHPKSRLFVFGAGADAVPLCAIAAKVGFQIELWDWRPTKLGHDKFPNVNLFIAPHLKK